MVVKENPQTLTMWHDCLGYPSSIMKRKIIENSHEHLLKGKEILQSSKISYETCSLEKLILIPSPAKIKIESPAFLECIQDDICGSIHPLCRTFRYFMILIDASSRWSHIYLLSTCNMIFVRFLA